MHPIPVALLVSLCFLLLVPSLRANLASELLETFKRLIRSDCHCAQYNCCSKWGYCGRTEAYCGDGCQSGPCNDVPMKKSSHSLITPDVFACVFPQLELNLRAQRYRALVEAMIASKWRPASKVEAAIFLAHVSHATNGLKTLAQSCPTPECEWSTAALLSLAFLRRSACNQYQSSWCSIQARPDVKYYGRGMLSLAYPCNYHHAGQALGLDLLNDPDVVSRSDKLAALTAIWFYSTSGMRELAQRGDFGGTVQKLNKHHCSTDKEYFALLAQGKTYYRVRQCFGLPEVTISLSCWEVRARVGRKDWTRN